MRKSSLILFSAWLAVQNVSAQHVFDVRLRPSGADVSPTMYGVFFEDINFGADGGLYAEMVSNRSFEAPVTYHPQTGERESGGLNGWKIYGHVTLGNERPAFRNNPHYAVLRPEGHRDRVTGLSNSGYFGMGVKRGICYDFSLYARCHGGSAQLLVELIGSAHAPLVRDTLMMTGDEWRQYHTTLVAPSTDAGATLLLRLLSAEGLDLDHVSLMPEDNWHGLRSDLVADLCDLHPGVFRFPGGCIVEGTELQSRYEWKKSVGPIEERVMNENRWNYTMKHRMFPDYYQSLGLGFYEYFLLAEKMGAAPLPILSCGIACQFQNSDDDPNAHVAPHDLQPYIDDVLDLVEFANGDPSTHWGALRAEMGHPAPFRLKYIGIGNEQWGELYPERLALFVKAIRTHCPNIQIVGSAGPFASGDRFDYGWEQMRRLKVDLVDEHYYMSPDWFLENARRYDNYPRRGPKVFAGEYAAHGKQQRNNFEAALAEAAFMTGLERNADVVRMATYAPLFAHVDGYQWRPDLIWFDNLRSVRTPNWYVQRLYGEYKGTRMVSLTENGRSVAGEDGLYASAVYDGAQKHYVVKIVNASAEPREVTLRFKDKLKAETGSTVVLHAAKDAENTLDQPRNVYPQTGVPIPVTGREAKLTVPAETFLISIFE